MYIYGNQNFPVPENLSFSKFILDKLRSVKGDEICLENGQTRETLTYKEVTQYAVNMSVAFSKMGVQKGDVIAIGSNPYLHFIPTTLGVLFTGATYTVFDENIGQAILKHRLELVKPKYLICSSTFWRTYTELIKSFDCIKTYIAVDNDVPDLKLNLTALVSVNEDVDSFEPVHVQEKKVTALILYSSGTTGVPKGIKISYFNFLSSVIILHGFRNMTSVRTAFIARTWSIYFYARMTLRFMSLGRKVVFANDLPVKKALPILRDCKVDIIFIYTAYVRDMADNSQPTDDYFDFLKVIYCVGSPLTAEMKKDFRRSFPKLKEIIQSYGCNECVEIISDVWGKCNNPESIGKASPNIIVKVVDLKTRAVLGPNQVGEICVKGPTVMKDYLNIARSEHTDEDGFYMTKDLGYYDEDEYFFFVDRLSDVINYQWFKVSPLELEKVLLQHPAVCDVGVVARPAPVVDEVPMAFVVKKPGTEVSEEELVEFVASQVSPHMQLRGGVMFIPEVPRNENGKILRRDLKLLIENTSS